MKQIGYIHPTHCDYTGVFKYVIVNMLGVEFDIYPETNTITQVLDINCDGLVPVTFLVVDNKAVSIERF